MLIDYRPNWQYIFCKTKLCVDIMIVLRLAAMICFCNLVDIRKTFCSVITVTAIFRENNDIISNKVNSGKVTSNTDFIESTN